MKHAALTLLLCLALWPMVAHAGQLHVSTFGLAEVARSPGFAALGTVVAVHAARDRVSLLVKRLWVSPGRQPQLWTATPVTGADGKEVMNMSSLTLVVGQTYEVPIYRGVKWTDPGESPIDRRLRHALDFGELKIGADVLYLGHEAEAATEPELRKVALFFGKPDLAGRAQKATVESLEAELGDYDLSAAALAELQRRGQLRAAAVVAIDDWTLASDALRAAWKKLDERQKAAFLDEAHVALVKRPFPQGLNTLIRNVEDELPPALWPQLVRLVSLRDTSTKDGARDRASWEERFERRWAEAKARPADRDVLQLVLRRHDATGKDQRASEAFTKWAAALSKPEQAVVAQLLGELVATESDAALKARTGVPHFTAWAELVTLSPSLEQARFFAALPLSKLQSFDERVACAGRSLELLTTLARAEPRTIAVVKGPMEQLLKSDSGDEFMHPVMDRGVQVGTAGITQHVEDRLGPSYVEAWRKLANGKP